MPTRTDAWPAGTPCWLDISVPDLTAAKKFYSALFGWSFVDSGEEFGHYNIAQVDDRAVAAIGPQQYEGQPAAWMVYVASNDADASAKLIAENGGTIVAAPMDIPGSGRMVVAQDPQGAFFGVWQSAEMIGAGVYMEPGSLVWTDVRTTEPDVGRAFYTAVFGYRYEAMEGAPADYTVIKVDGARDDESLGGIGGFMPGSEGTPPHWLPYFIVADADAAAAAATASGGTLPGEGFDSAWGKMAPITDPFGATFMVLGIPPSAG